MTDDTILPPQIIGLDDQSRACRLALAVFDDNPARYEAALAGADADVLIAAIIRNWVMALVSHHGVTYGRKTLERTIAGIAEHGMELGR
jgi:hypothetical protein